MEIRYTDIPNSKTVDDYSDDTEFILDDREPRYDKKALEEKRIIKIWPNEKGYDNALSREEAMRILD